MMQEEDDMLYCSCITLDSELLTDDSNMFSSTSESSDNDISSGTYRVITAAHKLGSLTKNE